MEVFSYSDHLHRTYNTPILMNFFMNGYTKTTGHKLLNWMTDQSLKYLEKAKPPFFYFYPINITTSYLNSHMQPTIGKNPIIIH